ncbi:MAG: hypothetical protein CMK59_02655 [Proteobacteria bacterium]|nr:hypothetical protein [Pseudomonadota bacterium]
MYFMLLLGCGNSDEQSYSYDAKKNSEINDVVDGDGDGFTDEEEISAGTNPDFAPSHPYEQGGYVVGNCSEGLPSELGPTDSVSMNIDGESLSWDVYQVGDGVENLVLKDQFNQEVELHSFCGVHIMLVLSSFT